MKIRSGFVSNSSSSSFIVIGEAKPETPHFDEYVIGQLGCNEFGWEHTTYEGAASMISFAWLQAEFCKDSRPDYMAMLLRVIKQHTGAKEVTCCITDSYTESCNDKSKRYGYIDHQSSVAEGANLEMFDDDETLARFLFSPDSYIQGGNDND